MNKRTFVVIISSILLVGPIIAFAQSSPVPPLLPQMFLPPIGGSATGTPPVALPDPCSNIDAFIAARANLPVPPAPTLPNGQTLPTPPAPDTTQLIAQLKSTCAQITSISGAAGAATSGGAVPQPPQVSPFSANGGQSASGNPSPSQPIPTYGSPGQTQNTPIPSSSSMSAPCPALTRNLSRGSHGADVTALQKCLISQTLLPQDDATGLYGPLTEAAVQQFQAQNGIVSSGDPSTSGYGAVGPRTRKALSNSDSNSTAGTSNSSSNSASNNTSSSNYSTSDNSNSSSNTNNSTSNSSSNSNSNNNSSNTSNSNSSSNSSANPAPTCSLVSAQATVSQGLSAYLWWTSTNATQGSISSLGTVAATGAHYVSPAQTTTYTATFTGNGGSVQCQATVTVTTGGSTGRIGATAETENPLGFGTVSWGPNRIDMFALGTDHAIWHRWWDGVTWSGWESLGGSLVSAPAVSSWGPNRLDVFAIGSDNQLWHKFWNGSWSGWEPLGGSLISAPAAVSWGPNRIDIFATAADAQLWHMYWSGSAWSGWEPLGGSLISGPAVTSRAANEFDVFATGGDSQLWHLSYGNGVVSGWDPLGGVIISSPAAVSWGSGRMDVFVTGTDNGLWHKYWIGNWTSGSWSGWESLGGGLISAPSVSSWGSNRLDVFVRGTDNGLWHKYWAGSWTGYESLGCIANTCPTPPVPPIGGAAVMPAPAAGAVMPLPPIIGGSMPAPQPAPQGGAGMPAPYGAM
jgi:hypothetical protein